MYIKESEVVDVINSLRSNEGSRLEGFMDEFLKKDNNNKKREYHQDRHY